MQTESALKVWGQPVPTAGKVYVQFLITTYSIYLFNWKYSRKYSTVVAKNLEDFWLEIRK